MLNLINWDKPLKVNDVVYNNSAEAYKALKSFAGDVKIVLNFKKAPERAVQMPNQPIKTQDNTQDKSQLDTITYRIKVRQYMTKSWEFNDQKNNGVPMPMRVMVGNILDETKGMVKMALFAKPMPSSICMKCGRTLTHPVSLHYGIGPECGNHFHISPFNSEEELAESMEELKNKMADIKWVGWIIKSAIEEKEAI